MYVGSAVNMPRRWQHHREDARNNKHHSKAFQNAWNKHGEDAFLFEVIEYVEDPDQLIEREQHWIEALESYTRGYNCSPTAGSPRGVKHSEEARQRMSESHKEYYARLAAEGKDPPSTGKKMRPEVIEVNRQLRLREHQERLARGEDHPCKGRKRTEEQNEANRQKAKEHYVKCKTDGIPFGSEGYKWTPEQIEKVRPSRIGRPQSEETRRKRSESLKGGKHSEETIAKRKESFAKTMQDRQDKRVAILKDYWDKKLKR